LTVAVNQGIVGGRYYRVHYRVKNIIGWTNFSPYGYILAAYFPDLPIPPVVTIVGTNAKIQFYIPFNEGSQITQAVIQIKKASGVYATETTDCDATTTAIFNQWYCLIPLVTLRDTTLGSWNLIQGLPIIA
jgi:hypothetical protein